MPEFERLQTESNLERAANAVAGIRETVLRQPLDLSLDKPGELIDARLWAAFDLGMVDAFQVAQDKKISFRVLTRAALYLSTRQQAPELFKSLIEPRVNTWIALDDFLTLADASDEFYGYDFGFIELIGRSRIEFLMREAESPRVRRGREFFDALAAYVPGKREHINWAIDLLLSRVEYLLEPEAPMLVQRFREISGVADKVSQALLKRTPSVSQAEHLKRLLIGVSPAIARQIMPMINANLHEAMRAGVRIRQLAQTYQPSQRVLNYLYNQPDQETCRAYAWCLRAAIETFADEPGYEYELQGCLTLAKMFISNTLNPSIPFQLLKLIAQYDNASTARRLFEAHDSRWFCTDSMDHHDFMYIQQLEYEQSKVASARDHLSLIEKHIVEAKKQRPWAIEIYIADLLEYASEEPELTMRILETHTVGKLEPENELAELLKVLLASSARNRAIAWKNRFIAIGKTQRTSPAREYVENTSLSFSRLGITANLQKLEEALARLTPVEQKFVVLALRKQGLLSPEVYQYLLHPPKKIAMQKTGSQFEVFTGGQAGVIKHTLPIEGAQIWINLSEEQKNPIPVAPVLKTKRPVGNTREVYSRICGIALHELMSNELGLSEPLLDGWIDKMMAVADEQSLTLRRLQTVDLLFGDSNQTVHELCTQVFAILDGLKKRGIDHGHPHLLNFTVEFIDRNFLTNHLQQSWTVAFRDGEIEMQLPTINNIPWSSKDFTFDIGLAQRDPEKWWPVVRVIDFDMARLV
ncbi:hypothetical protein KBC79_06820 [Candidatus Woesebacteria bacterium]|nr:hypothetical protein [Candidatus Woesebacteria bacterium]